MAKIDTVVLRRFVSPVDEAEIVRKEATAAMLDVFNRPRKEQEKVIARFEKANEAYSQAIGELLGGVRQLLKDAEAEDAGQL
ncbi:hypothetical protein ACIPL1_27265 [Pseudomonas sp. NPDC090202]|uniref:hypothetical protein n=1 Tax=Pseudomonas sp. NPDC090202 TaxID=3364476 RepID=UPI0038239ABD